MSIVGSGAAHSHRQEEKVLPVPEGRGPSPCGQDWISESEETLRDHTALCKATETALGELFSGDPLLQDIPANVAVEEVEAQVALLNGQAITVHVERERLPTLKVIIPSPETTVSELKKAVRRTFEVQQQKDTKQTAASSRKFTAKISWRYVWQGRCFEDGNNNIVKIAPHGLELTQTINLQRQEFLQKMCELMGYTSKTVKDLKDEQLEHLIVDKKHKLLYCYVPKVACTNWKRILMILTGKWQNGTDPLQIPASLAHSPSMFEKLNTFSQDERAQILTEYTKFLLVRHPFERLLSAYRNKLEGSTESARYFQKRIGKTIVKNFRANPTNESLVNGHDVSFTEFIQYLLTPNISQSYQSNQSFNEHWEPASKLCHPCAIKYNVIGKYETLLDDSSLALHLVGADGVTFPTGHRTAGTSSYLKKYFDPIPLGIVRKLYKVYELDFQLFDYGLEDVLGFDFG